MNFLPHKYQNTSQTEDAILCSTGHQSKARQVAVINQLLLIKKSVASIFKKEENINEKPNDGLLFTISRYLVSGQMAFIELNGDRAYASEQIEIKIFIKIVPKYLHESTTMRTQSSIFFLAETKQL